MRNALHWTGTEGCDLVEVVIGGAFSLSAFPEFIVGGMGDVVAWEWRDVIGVHWSYDFGADKHEEFGFGFGGGFGLEDAGADPGDIPKQRDSADFCEGLSGDQATDGEGLSFAEFDGGLDTFDIGSGDALDGVLSIDFAEFGDDLHADEIAIDNGWRYDEACAEAAEGGGGATADTDDGGNGKFAACKDTCAGAAEDREPGFSEEFDGAVGLQPVDKDFNFAVFEDSAERCAGTATE
ncbi:MAG: hypothetical protein RL215_517 [Planctomycetota bacterium]